MKAVAISVRIADFLKQFPPFQFMKMKDLVEMAEVGKVKFHEEGEMIFLQGQPRDQWIYVIQQGKVSILEEAGDNEKLVDYRGPGDLLGLQGIRSEEPYQNSCRTDMETILYALPRAKFVSLAERSSEARRYLAAYFTLNPTFHEDEETSSKDGALGTTTLRKGGLIEVEEPHAVAMSHLVTVSSDTPAREVARLLKNKRTQCVLIVDEKGWPLGKLTDADFRDRVIERVIDDKTTASEIMFKDIVVASRHDNTGELLVKLTRNGKHFLVITENGELQSKATGLVTDSFLFLQYCRFPTVIGEAIASATDLQSLRELRDRMEALILEFLEDRSALKWLMKMVGILNRKMSYRVLSLMQEAMAQEGWGSAPVEFDWLTMGSGGRDELLIRSAIYHSLVYRDPPESLRSEAVRYFRELAKRVGEGLRQCGFMESEQGILAQNQGWCASITEMKQRFKNLISRPVEFHVYNARDAFDFHSVQEPESSIVLELRQSLSEQIVQDPSFVRYMASDSLMSQPPKTIFQGYVVDDKGAQREELAIKRHALLPIVDIARVLALESGQLNETSTYGRLKLAAERITLENEESGAMLNELAEAFLVAQFARISRGIKAGTDGAVIRPANLDAETRTLLVTSFRTILAALEFLAQRYHLKLRS